MSNPDLLLRIKVYVHKVIAVLLVIEGNILFDSP